MKAWPRPRGPLPAAPAQHPSPIRIAVLEHDLLGIAPAPGTMAAAVIALRSAGTCLTHQPVDISSLGERPGVRGLCTRCGQHMTTRPDGEWEIVNA